MPRKLAVLVGCAAMTVACGGSPTGPSVSAARSARLSRTRFLAFGDSITLGEVTSPIGVGGISKLVVVPTASYPAVLQSQLQASYPAQATSISVNNQGKGGEWAYDGALRFADVLASTRPDAVLLEEGLNDLGAEGAVATAASMQSMVRIAKNGNVRVFVGSMIPSPSNRLRSQNLLLLESYNDALTTMCTREGVTYVDLYSGMMPQAEQLIGADGLHPNEAGYRKIAEIFFAAIKGALEER